MAKSIEVQARNGTWYLMRILPYRTIENVIKGAVITFTDIIELKQKGELVKESEATIYRISMAVRDSNDAITMQDLEGHILAWNPKAERIYGWSEVEALTMNISSLVPEKRKEEELAMVKKLSLVEALEPYHAQRLNKDGRIVNVLLTVSSLVNKPDKHYVIGFLDE